LLGQPLRFQGWQVIIAPIKVGIPSLLSRSLFPRMKTTSMAVVCLVLTLVGVRAQVASVPVSTGQSTGTATIQPANYQVVASGPNQNVWQSETYATNADGEVVTNLHQYTELATGLNYQDANGNWMPAQEVIESFAQGAIARQGQHQIIFANNLNTAGSIDLQTPDGKRLLSNILGLGYYDTSSGQSVLIGQIQDSQGELISANQVLYTNAFNGVKADVRYTYRRGSFEQDVILREQPPAPATLGMNPATTELEVLTEFLNPPGATVMPRPGQAGEDEDDDVDWGTMRIIRGKAFDLDAGSNDAYPLTAVTKQYGVVQGRNILIEKVRLPDIQATLSTLPLQSSGRSSLPSDLAKNFTLPRTPLAATQTRPIKMATSTPAGKGYVLDYITINTTSSNQTFRADTTYFVNGSDYLTGTAVFEGGTVIKFSDNSALNPQLNINGNWVCQTSPYHPAIFTTMDDNSVGDIISGSTGSPGIVSGTHYFTVVTSTNTSISNFRFSYPKYGLSPQSSGPFDVWDCQFVQCQYAISVGVNTDIRLHNVLFTAAGYAAVSFLTGVGSLIGENVTANVTDLVDTTAKKAVAIDLTNSIVFYTGSSLWATNVYTNCTVFNPSRAYVQNVGAGAYYQTNGSPYLHAGTTNITPALLADLATKTVWPPVVYANTNITNNLTLTIQALRDTNASPDMGYHHDPLDYILDGANFYSTLTLTNGVAVGCYDQPGIEIRGSNSIVSIGTPLAPNWLVRYPAAQEQPWFPDGSSYAAGQNITEVPSGTARPSGLFQFTHFSTPAGGGPDFYDRGSTSFTALTIQHSEFWGGTNDFSGLTNATSTLLVQNNLFFRSSIYASNSAATSLALTNNTIYGTTLALVQPASAAWYFYDNDVDSSTLSTNSAITNGYNAFINCSNNFIGTSNIVSTNAIGYQSAKLGNFYQPISSPLLQAGSTTADQVGLYAFTTQTNQLEETNSIVDIGYHYVALGTNGLPLDVNGDGIPDYLQNFNSAPVITVQPTNQVVQQGSNAVFNVTATGTAPLSYQWWFNATNKLAASTNTTLTVTNVQSTNTGNYTVVVTNVAGSVTSSVASLTLLAAPTISIQPTNVTALQGSNAVFSVTVTGSSPFNFQWQFNGSNVPNNIITTVAGNGTAGYSGDGGPATNANLYYPHGASIDAYGNLYIADYINNCVRKVGANGIINTIAGNGTAGYSGDGGAATNATMDRPAAVAVDSVGNLLIADQLNNRIRKVSTNGIITTVAGNGSAGYSGDGGAATNASLH